MIDVEITVSEGGAWLKLQVPEQTLLDWINVKYSKPVLEDMVRIYAVKFQAIGGLRTAIRDFQLEAWRFE
jgi:hypothetical protein